MIERNGLAESLEEYTLKCGVTHPRDWDARRLARRDWIEDGLRLLGVSGRPAWSGPRVAPGVAVPIPLLTPADVIEVEP